MINNARKTVSQQQGAVLVVGLLILLIMTLVGVTAMSTSTLEERMSANGMNSNIAFQAAESAAITATADTSTATAAMNSVSATVAGPTVNYAGGAVLGSSSVTYIGTVLVDGWSIVGSGSGAQFTIASTGAIASANAKATMTQGWLFILAQ